jgi:hypothetical protein
MPLTVEEIEKIRDEIESKCQWRDTIVIKYPRDWSITGTEVMKILSEYVQEEPKLIFDF